MSTTRPPVRLSAKPDALAPKTFPDMTPAIGQFIKAVLLDADSPREVQSGIHDRLVRIYGADVNTFLVSPEGEERAAAEAAMESRGETRVEEPPFAMSLQRGLNHLQDTGRATPAEVRAQRLAIASGNVRSAKTFIDSRRDVPAGTLGAVNAKAMAAETEAAANAVLRYC